MHCRSISSMPPGLDKLKHIVVLMMENRSFNHMLGYLKPDWPDLDGLNGNETNPDTAGRSQRGAPPPGGPRELGPDSDHPWGGGEPQIFWDVQGDDEGKTQKQGFFTSYFSKRQNLGH